MKKLTLLAGIIMAASILFIIGCGTEPEEPAATVITGIPICSEQVFTDSLPVHRLLMWENEYNAGPTGSLDTSTTEMFEGSASIAVTLQNAAGWGWAGMAWHAGTVDGTTFNFADYDTLHIALMSTNGADVNISLSGTEFLASSLGFVADGTWYELKIPLAAAPTPGYISLVWTGANYADGRVFYIDDVYAY